MNQKPRRERGSGRTFLRGQIGWIQYYSHGAQVKESTGIRVITDADWKKVEKKLRQKIGEVEAGVHRDTRNIRYEDLRNSFYRDYEINSRKSLRRDGEGKPRLDKVVRLDDFFSGWRVSEIDVDAIGKFVAGEQKRNLAAGTINRSVSALRRMFNLAKKQGKLRDVPYFPMVPEAPAREGFFERDEYERLRAALPAHLRLPLALGYFTAMRLSEVLMLRWKRVHLAENESGF
jgi:integrase